MNPPEYRPELPDLPRRMRSLPVHRGYPCPWFIDKNPATGEYDFRVIDARKVVPAVRDKRCWVCGERMGRNFAFVVGPMCAVNRVSSEPPSHIDCADFAARACPFLSNPQEKRRGDPMQEYAEHNPMEAPGIAIMRNPGVALVWVTDAYSILRPSDYVEQGYQHTGPGKVTVNLRGALYRMGEPVEVRWYSKGRSATRDEVLQSIEAGFPTLLAGAEGDKAVALLHQQKAATMQLLPQ